jgi:predicted RNase H-like HicB family nuclease
MSSYPSSIISGLSSRGAEKEMRLTGIIKKSGDYYVALCIEINVSSQGESIEEARKMLQEACDEYLSYMKDEGLEDEIKSVPVDILREFLMDDVECVRPSSSWVYSESITFEVCASV